MRIKYLLLLFAALSPLRATIFYDQSPPNGNAIDITDYRAADDFTLAGSSTIANINFWYQAQFQTDLSQVSYAIYANNAGALGSQLYSGNALTPTTSVDGSAPFANAFFATFAVPNLALNAGTYWLELHAGATLTDASGFTVSWYNAADNATADLLYNLSLGTPNVAETLSGFTQEAFQLDGTGTGGNPGTPEPSTAWLLGAGLVVVAGYGRRRGYL